MPNDEVPHVTIIRPCKGREPYLYKCLASTFQQDYPKSKLTIYLCVSSRDDAACQTIQQLLADYPEHDATLLVEEEDPALHPESSDRKGLGPNPKIRNMSRAYREAKGDLVWILDCNIWVSVGVCGRMVDRICGFSRSGQQRAYKFVHHIPVAVDVPASEAFQDQDRGNVGHTSTDTTGIHGKLENQNEQRFGGRLDEAFLSSAHAKMYVAINTVAVAPCICGKSSMFRRSHLNALTNDDHSMDTRFGSGIDHFSENICEDHLIGDLLWKAKIPSTMPAAAKTWRNHGLVFGDIALQPVSAMSVSSYIARRVRWLRVRKFTVPMATLVEPGTESFMCSAIGAFGLTTSPLTKDFFGTSWSSTLLLWLLSVVGWAVVDWTVYILLQSGRSIETASSKAVTTPPFARALPRWQSRRPFFTWLKSWLAREALTFPVWFWAIWGGVTVVWRDKKLWVGLDMKVHEFDESKNEQTVPLLSNGQANAARGDDAVSAKSNGSKVRQD